MRQDANRAKRETNTLPDICHAELACVCLIGPFGSELTDDLQNAAVNSWRPARCLSRA